MFTDTNIFYPRILIYLPWKVELLKDFTVNLLISRYIVLCGLLKTCGSNIIVLPLDSVCLLCAPDNQLFTVVKVIINRGACIACD